MKWKIVLLLLFLLSTNVALSKEPKWLKKIKEIEPLFSSRGDVIKLFGQPLNKERASYLNYYDLENGRMSVLYSTGECISKKEGDAELIDDWNVPEWTAIEITFTPKKRISLKKLNVNFAGFQSSVVGDVPGAMIYENDELGIDYTVFEGKIEDITFRPPKKYIHLHCK